MKTAKIILVLGAIFLGYTAFAADPVISDVTVRQRWPWSNLVDIDYVLTCDGVQVVDIEVNGFNAGMPLTLPPASLSGDLYNVSAGTRRIVWDPTATTYAIAGVLDKFRVELAPKPVPLYMIVDLTKTASVDGPSEAYVYEADLRAGAWGSWVENPVTNRGTVIQSVIWTGVTNDITYATDKLVLRRVLPGTFTMGGDGETAYSTTLTKACYASIFLVTEAQWAKIMGGSGSSMPKVLVSHNNIRGATNDVPAINWPATGSRVSPNSFLGQLRLKTGLDDFDLPTEAQSEYLCRAGTTTVFNDGNAAAKYTGTDYRNNGNTNDYLDVLGWYKQNSGNALHPVGQKAANAWGLYDTLGNVTESCLDWRGAGGGGIDPAGPLTGLAGQRRMRGGRFNYNADQCRPAFRTYVAPDVSYASLGFRIVRTLP